MPAILDRLVQQLMDKGKIKSVAYAIAVSTLKKSGNLDSKETQQKKVKEEEVCLLEKEQ